MTTQCSSEALGVYLTTSGYGGKPFLHSRTSIARTSWTSPVCLVIWSIWSIW